MIRFLRNLLTRVSRWMRSLFMVERPVMRCPYYHVIDTRMPRYEIVNGEWVRVASSSGRKWCCSTMARW